MDADDRYWVTRLDASGVRDTTGFADTGDGLMAVTLTVPPAPVGGVVLCPSLFTEALRNYRREAQLAHAIARAGLAVARPQYRGTGNSDDAAIDRTTIVADATFAADLLRSHAQVDLLAFGGTRFGGLVAATVAADAAGAPLVLVEPAESARTFLDGGLRAKVISTFKSDGGKVTRATLLERLQRDGWIELLGHQLGEPLYRTAEGWTLDGVLGTEPRPILLLQLGEDGPLRPEYDALTSGWRALGFDVEVARAGASRTWWFLHEQIEEGRKIRQKGLDEADEVMQRVVSWLGRSTSVEAAR